MPGVWRQLVGTGKLVTVTDQTSGPTIHVARPTKPSLWRTAPFSVVTMVICALAWVAELASLNVYAWLALSPASGRHEPWRFMSSAFLHAPDLRSGIIHIGSNMFSLWMLGRILEPALQTWRFACVYLISALGGSVAFVLMALPPNADSIYGTNWYTGVVGASGAIFGLFGALFVMQKKMGASTRNLWGLLVFNALIAFSVPGIAWQSHVGGLLVGAAATWCFFHSAKKAAVKGVKPQPWPWLAGLVLLLVALTVGKYLIS